MEIFLRPHFLDAPLPGRSGQQPGTGRAMEADGNLWEPEAGTFTEDVGRVLEGRQVSWPSGQVGRPASPTSWS